MLVLSRRVGETVVIDDNIRVTVVSIQGNHVRLSFSAPPDVRIMRSELLGEGRVARKEEPCHAGR
jgi:carbon storage regulator